MIHFIMRAGNVFTLFVCPQVERGPHTMGYHVGGTPYSHLAPPPYVDGYVAVSMPLALTRDCLVDGSTATCVTRM